MSRDHQPVRLHMVGNAHIDPMWIWDWREGMHEVLQTFRAAVDRLDEEPTLTFTASSASYYHWVEQVSPELFGRIKELVAQSRWIVTGGQWVEPDCNLPSGESVCRQFLYGQRYLAEHLGVTATVGYNIDSFGHAGTLPQLLVGSGIESYVMMRPGEHEKAIASPAFWWEGVDGSAVPAYRIPYEYGTEGRHEDEVIRKRSAELLERSHELGYPLMAFFGVGDHGGGPTRLAMRTIRELSTSSEGSVGFSSPPAYFEALRDALAHGQAELPRVTGELQWHAVGCYSVRASLKRANARAEDALVTAEKMAELCRMLTGNMVDVRAELAEAWRGVLFAQFHDALGGTAPTPPTSSSSSRWPPPRPEPTGWPPWPPTPSSSRSTPGSTEPSGPRASSRPSPGCRCHSSCSTLCPGLSPVSFPFLTRWPWPPRHRVTGNRCNRSPRGR